MRRNKKGQFTSEVKRTKDEAFDRGYDLAARQLCDMYLETVSELERKFFRREAGLVILGGLVAIFISLFYVS